MDSRLNSQRARGAMPSNRRPPRATLRDVAAHSDVSLQTVSNVVNGRWDQMSDVTKQRVQLALAELSYHPSVAGRSLRLSRLHALGIVIPGALPPAHFNPMLHLIMGGLNEVARESGYGILIEIGSSPTADSKDIASLLANRMDGAFLMGWESVPEPRRWLTSVIERHLPVILLFNNGGTELPSVTADNYGGSYQLVEVLVAKGHRRIGFVSADADYFSMIQDRHRGYRDALANAGIRPSPQMEILDGSWDPHHGRSAAAQLLGLDQPPTAIVAANDYLAMGVMSEVKARGLRIPADIAVTGFNDFDFSSFLDPPLTTVAFPGYEVGRIAAHTLIQIVEGRPTPEHVVLPVTVRLRNST